MALSTEQLAILVSAIVPSATAVAVTWISVKGQGRTAEATRRHEAELARIARTHDRRADAYVDALAFFHAEQARLRGATVGVMADPPTKEPQEIVVLFSKVQAFGSQAIYELFREAVTIWSKCVVEHQTQGSLSSGSSDSLMATIDKLRQQIASELQS